MRVLVTRPEPDASRTAALVARLGHDPVLLPLFERTFEPRLSVRIAMPHSAIIFTSANGVRAFSSAGGTPDAAVPVYAVGEATAAAAREAGFVTVRTGAGTALDLAEMIAADLAGGKFDLSPERPLLYLAGEPRRPDLEANLVSGSVPVSVVTAYHMKIISYSADFLLGRKLSPPPDAILLFSANAATRLTALMEEKPVAEALDHAVPVCLSHAIAAELGESLRARAQVAEAPNEAALLASLAALR